MVNIVLKDNFRSLSGSLNVSRPEQSGRTSWQSENNVLRIAGEDRWSLDINGTTSDALYETDRNIDRSGTGVLFDRYGNVTAEGPLKDKIEKYFADNPDVAKELKTVASLNSLKAAQAALDLYTKEKGSANGSQQQQKAWADYNIRSMNIQTLSGVMSLTDGKLRSAAVDYIDMIADPTGASASSAKDATNRLA